MSTINVSGYNGIINNLTVLGTLTAAGYTPSGNLSVVGNLSATGTTTSTGLLTATNNAAVGGNLTIAGNLSATGTTTSTGLLTATNNAVIGGNLTIAGSLLAISLASNTSQALVASTETPINFGNIISNTLTTCTLTNTNSQFTYTGTPNTLWLITANCRTDNSPATSGSALALWVRKNGVGPYYGEVYTSTYGSTICSLNCTTMVSMSTNDYIEIRVYPSYALTIGVNNTYSVSAVTIAQI